MPLRFKICLLFIIFAGLSYLIGSINFAILVTKKYTGKDVRSVGSGNAGMTNVMRAAGTKAGIITFAGDFLKAVVAVLLGTVVLTNLIDFIIISSQYGDTELLNFVTNGGHAISPVYGGMVCGLFCITGHAYPAYFDFKGGKGVTTCFAMIIVLDWRIALMVLGVFLIVFFVSRIVSLSSMIAGLSFSVFTYLMYSQKLTIVSSFNSFITQINSSEYNPFYMPDMWFAIIGALVFGIVIVINHIPNIRRMIRGEEKQIKFSKK